MTAERDSTMTLDTSRILALAAEIRRVDGGNKSGAAELAERLMPFIDAHLATRDAVVNDDESKRKIVHEFLRFVGLLIDSAKQSKSNVNACFVDWRDVCALRGEIPTVQEALEYLASRKVTVPDGWIFYYADDEGTPYAHYCATRDDIYSQVGVWMCGTPDEAVLSDFGDDMLDGVTETLLEEGAFYPEGDPPCFLRKAMLASQDEVK